jgi:diguanylate cyclase (GGDEF)-like protein/PAS domain S-box-containing protein
MFEDPNREIAPLDLSNPQLLSAVLETANDAIVITEAETSKAPHPRIVYANEAYLRMTGYTLPEVIAQSPRILQGPDTCRATLDRIRQKLEAWEPFREEVLNYRKDGTPFWVELNVRPLADEAGWYTHWVSVQRDVTGRRHAMDALARHARDLEEAQRLAKLGTWRCPVASDDVSFSTEIGKILGAGPEEDSMKIARLCGLVDARDLRGARDAFDRITLLGEPATFELHIMRDGLPFRTLWVEGHPEHDGSGTIIAARGLCQDITERRNIEQSLLWNATHDSLTGLLNIDGLRAQAPRIISRARSAKGSIMVGLVDLDHLKLVNDTLGHAVGDALIIEVSRRLQDFFGEDACVARLGGDEFVFIECNRRDQARLSERLQDLVNLLRQPHDYHGRQLDCAGSVGVVVTHDFEPSLDSLLRNADLAMYRAKEVGRGGFVFFSAELQAGVERRVAHLDLARLAIGSKLVVPHFQPKVSLETGDLVGFEALLRLHIGERLLPPSAVEHAFENVELATRLGDEMLRCVLEQIRHWNRENFRFGSVAINVSGAELLRSGYAERVLDALARAAVPACVLEIEVTEGVLFGRGADRAAAAIGRLRDAGVRIVLDDFGTGYASLTHVKSLPISGIKIDKSFVGDMLKDDSDASIVRAVIGLAEALSIDLVAEGVETEAQAEFLRANGCKVAQGYLFGRALPANEISDLQIGSRGDAHRSGPEHVTGLHRGDLPSAANRGSA